MSSTEEACCTHCEYTLEEFLLLSSDPDKLLTFLYAHKLLRTSCICECGTTMRLYNGVFKCCRRYKCFKRKKRIVKKCSKSVSQLRGTFFEKRKLQKDIICKLIAYWCFIKPPRQEFLINHLKVSSTTTVEFFRHMREVCAIQIRGKSDKLGGPGLTVQIVRIKVRKRNDNHRKIKNKKYIFVGMELESKRIFVERVKNCNATKLLFVVNKYILPKTTVVSNLWKAYKCLEIEGFQQLMRNHSISFVDSGNKVHPQKVGKVFHEIKLNISRLANYKYHSQGHLLEYLYRYIHFRQDNIRIHNIFTTIAEVYNVTSSPLSIEVCNDIDLSIAGEYREASKSSNAEEGKEINSFSIVKQENETTIPFCTEEITSVSNIKMENETSNPFNAEDYNETSIPLCLIKEENETSIPFCSDEITTFSVVKKENETSILCCAEEITCFSVVKKENETSIPVNAKTQNESLIPFCAEANNETSFSSSAKVFNEASIIIARVCSDTSIPSNVKAQAETFSPSRQKVHNKISSSSNAKMQRDKTTISITNLYSKTNSLKAKARTKASIHSKANFRSIQQILDDELRKS